LHDSLLDYHATAELANLLHWRSLRHITIINNNNNNNNVFSYISANY